MGGGAFTRLCPEACCLIIRPCVSCLCLSAQMLHVWAIVCAKCAHARVPRPDSFRCEGFWEIRLGWLSVRTQWGPSKHIHGQMSLLACPDSETWLRQMQKPLKRRFFLGEAKWGLSGQMCEESHRKHRSFVLNPADNSQAGYKKRITSTGGFNLKLKSVPARRRHTWRPCSHCGILFLLWRLLFQRTVVSAWFHFISLHHPALSQPPCNASVGKLFKTALCMWVATLLFTFPCSVN